MELRGRCAGGLAVLWILLSLLLLVQCRSGVPDEGFTPEAATTPTLHPLLSNTSIPAFTPTPGTPVAETMPVSQPTATPLMETVYVSVYDDVLNPAWSLENSYGVNYDTDSETAAHRGRFALAVRPTQDFGVLLFSLREDAPAAYPRDRVLGIRFWLYSGENYIATSDLGVYPTGSNQHPYWLADDDSVAAPVPGEPAFSEDRLYFLDVNRDIPPDTWVEIVMWLDERQYDPEYRYLTGFIVKNDSDFRQMFYLDRVQLIVLREAS